jgi:hypothetical protein
MHSPGGDDGLWEWIEILYKSNQAVNLNGWVFDDDDDSALSAANITSAGGTRNTIVPAGGAAVLYPGDEFGFMPQRFNAAWGGNVPLIGVDGLTVLTDVDAIGLWPSYSSYLSDTIPMSTMSPRRNFTHATASIDYSTSFPEADDGHSIAWSGSGAVTSGANWIASTPGVSDAITSTMTTIAGAQINSTSDRGNPGAVRSGTMASGLVITEIMFAPSSPQATVGYTESDFEWVEVFNNTGALINFDSNPHVFDDDDGDNITAANLTAGELDIGEIGILFNSQTITVEQMQTMWGDNFNYIPVSSWPLLNNSGAETIAIWASYFAYNSEPVVDVGRTHENALTSVTYNTVAGQGWPTVNDQSSIWLNSLTGDPNAGASWRRAGASGDTLSHLSLPILAETIDHEGGDVGSPGLAPGSVVISAAGDYNDDGIVDAADYVLWRKAFGTMFPLPNGPPAGTTIGPAQYDSWIENFGQPAGGSSGTPTVPEPQTILTLVLSLLAWPMPKRSIVC